MWFWWFLFVCNLLIPVCMILGGRMMWKHCPKEINGMLGYRTRRSIRNPDTWRFAHDFCGRLWWKVGWVMLWVTVAAQILFFGSSEEVFSIVGSVISMAQCMILIGSIFPVERALKRTFYEDGNRKDWRRDHDGEGKNAGRTDL